VIAYSLPTGIPTAAGRRRRNIAHSGRSLTSSGKSSSAFLKSARDSTTWPSADLGGDRDDARSNSHRGRPSHRFRRQSRLQVAPERTAAAPRWRPATLGRLDFPLFTDLSAAPAAV
jgi:hypothetical protein